MSETYVCHFCGMPLKGFEVNELDNTILCDHCLEKKTTLCECCLERIWIDEVEGIPNYTLCRYCYDNHYYTCDHCGRLIHTDDAHYLDDCDEPYCQDCFNKLCQEVIHHYHYKPSPIFYGGEGLSLFLGIELEIDGAGECDDNARQILDITNQDTEHIYCKHDGSLNDGFEIVSHPMTLEYHQNNMQWNEIMSKAIEQGYTSHNAGSCGLHIHCNRDFFGRDYAEQENVIGRIVFITEIFWNELVVLSRRTQGALNRWAAKYATISNTVSETYKKAKDKDCGRYVAVNLANTSTIEFRMFRGTLRYETFIATLQLVDEICRLAVHMDDAELERLPWSEFVRQIDKDKKPELVTYLKSKRLYVNETVSDSEEV